MDDLPFNELLRRVRSGDAAAFEPVVRRYEGRLRAWLAAQAPPGIDIDEIAQRSFVVVFTNLSQFEIGTDFSAWLFSVARFQLKTEITRLRRITDYHSRYAPDLMQQELARFDEEPSEAWEVRLDSLRDCLQTLGEHARRFLAWRYEEEIPLEEMSARSGRSVPAIKKQLWILRRKLRDCVESRVAMAQEGHS